MWTSVGFQNPCLSQTPSKRILQKVIVDCYFSAVCLSVASFWFQVFSRSSASPRTVVWSLYAQHEQEKGTLLRCIPAEASRGTKSWH